MKEKLRGKGTLKSTFVFLSGLLVIYLQFIKAPLFEFPPLVSTFFSVSVLLIMPGYILSRFFLKTDDFSNFELLPAYLCLGCLWLLVPGLASYILRFSADTMTRIYLGCVFFLVLVYGLIKPSQGIPGKRNMKNEFTLPCKIIFTAIVIISFLMGLYYGGFISGNFLFHMSFIRKLIELPRIAYANAYFNDSHAWTYGYNIWYLFYAMVSRIAHADPVTIWINMVPFVVPFGILAVFSFFRRLSGRHEVALLGAGVFFLNQALLNYLPSGMSTDSFWYWSEIAACPNFLARDIFIPVILCMGICCLSDPKGKERYLYMISALSFTLCLIHMYFFLLLLYMLFCLALFSIIVRHDFWQTRDLAKVSLSILLPGILFVFYMFAVLFPTVNPGYLSPFTIDAYHPVIFLKNNLPLIDPVRGLLFSPVNKIAFLLLPFVLALLKKDRTAFFCSSIVVTTVLIYFNPPLLALVRKFHPSLDRIYRIVEIVPYPLITGFIVYRACCFLGKSRLLKILGIVVVLLLSVPVKHRLSGVVHTRIRSIESMEQNGMFFGLVRHLIPPGSVVLIDMPKSTFWTTYFSHYIVAHAFNCVLPPNVDQTGRVEDVNYFFGNPLTSRSMEILEKYGVDYLFIDKNYAKNKDFTKEENTFRNVFESGMFDIYKVIKKQG